MDVSWFLKINSSSSQNKEEKGFLVGTAFAKAETVKLASK